MPEPASDWVQSYKRLALGLVMANPFISNLVPTTSGPIRILTILAFASSISLWCLLDARIHGRLFLRSFAWLMMFTWPVGVLAHLVWTRGAKGILTYLAAILLCALSAGLGAGAANLFAPG